jgi:arabinofuranosyltransferase
MQSSIDLDRRGPPDAAAKREPRRAPTSRWLRPELWLLWGGLLALALLLLTRARRYWPFTLDDAFITLRYSRHLADGLGPSWNPGAEPAEGYTTALWMALLALAQALGLDGLWIAKSSGLLFALGAVAIAARLGDHACVAAALARAPRAFASLSVFVLAASYWPLSLHAVSGMETTFSCMILTLFFYYSVRIGADADASASAYRGLALAALLATLTRPEAGLPCVATLAAHLVWCTPAKRPALLRATLLWLVLPGALYLALRWSHFGLLFPLSFYVKATNRPAFAGLPDVIGFFEPFVLQQPWWSVLFVLGVRGAPSLRPALLGSACFVVFFVFPEHIMAFESRYLLPLFPLLIAVIGVGTASLVQRLERALAQRQRVLAARAAIAALLLGCAFLPLPGNAEVRAQNWIDYGKSLQSAHVALAHDLASARARGGRVALLDVGAIGYYADWYTIDTFGLNDAHVALSQRKDIEYVLAKQPDLLIVVSRLSGRYAELFEWETPLYQSARARGYLPTCEYKFDPNYYLQVLMRPGASTVRGDVCRSSTRALPVP